MKPFDLEKALAGDPVITKNGKKVSEFKFFSISKEFQTIYAVLENRVLCWYHNGNYRWDYQESDYDLFMAPKVKKLYIAIHKTPIKNNNHIILEETFQSIDEIILRFRVNPEDYIIKEIEIEV